MREIKLQQICLFIFVSIEYCRVFCYRLKHDKLNRFFVMSEPSSGLFEKNAAKIQAAVRQALTDGTARIEFRPSSEHVHPIDSQPLIEVYADDELLGRFETYTQAAQYMVYVANAAGAYRGGFLRSS